MKKILTIMLAIVLIIPSFFLITACNDKEAKVMNVSLNPELEFVLDGNDKVVSVNALNDEGNYLIAKVDFKNLSAEDAVNLFIQATKDNGFLLEGNVSQSDNQIKISISGDNAEKLYNNLKNTANSYLSELGITATISEGVELTKEYLQNLVSECMQELSTTEIQAMSEEKLVELIEKSRKETQNFVSQELKEFYYQSRANELKMAELEKLEEVFENSSSLLAPVYSGIVNALQELETAVANFNNKYEEMFLSSESEYQQALREFISKKQALLDARLEGILSETQLQNLEQLANLAETALNTAKQSAQLGMQAVQSGLQTAISSIEGVLNTIVSLAPSIYEQAEQSINNAIETAKTNYKNSFETLYANYIANSPWVQE